MKLYTLGVNDELSPYMKEKVILSNQVSIMCAIIGLAYFPFLYVHYEVLSIYPCLLFFISSFLIVMNYLGLIQISRFLASFQMLILASMFHASIIQSGEPYLISFFSCMVFMTFIPWLIYSFREKTALIVTLVISYGLLLASGLLNRLLEVPVDVTFFRESYLNPMTYASTVAVAAFLLFKLKNDKSRGLEM